MVEDVISNITFLILSFPSFRCNRIYNCCRSAETIGNQPTTAIPITIGNQPTTAIPITGTSKYTTDTPSVLNPIYNCCRSAEIIEDRPITAIPSTDTFKQAPINKPPASDQSVNTEYTGEASVSTESTFEVEKVEEQTPLSTANVISIVEEDTVDKRAFNCSAYNWCGLFSRW